jgi:hypothetical protein
MTETTTKPKINAGTVLSTPGALEAFRRNDQSFLPFLERHLNGDWSDTDLCEEDREANEQALVDGSRLLSAYRLKDGTKVWCITEAVGENGHREATTFLLPEEY